MELRLSWREQVALKVYGIQALEVFGVQVDGEVPIGGRKHSCKEVAKLKVGGLDKSIKC